MLANGAKVNEKDYNNHKTALMYAAEKGHKDVVEKLLANGAKVNEKDYNNHKTALMWAAYKGHKDVVEALLAKGENINVNEKDYNNHKTALIWAAEKGHTEVVKALLAKGADFSCIAPSYKDYELILKYLLTLTPEKQAECLRNMPGGAYADIRSYVTLGKPMYFDSLFIKPNASHNAIKKILSEMNFEEHINNISKHYVLMRKKSLSNSNYTEAVVAAETLLKACVQAKLDLFQSNDHTEKKIEKFQKTCIDAIEQARPVLEKHRSWVKVLAEFLLAVITLPLSLLSYGFGLFSVKTKSEQLIDKLNEAFTVNPKKNS